MKFPRATHLICCFQYKDEAYKFYRELQIRLGKFNLNIATEKTKIIAFGRFAEERCAKIGRNKPETFDFLGFTHYCSKSEQGKFRVKRKTSRKKYKAKLLRMKQWIRNSRKIPILIIVKELRAKLRGHFNYYGITDNEKMISNFYYDTIRLLFKWLNRRSQRASIPFQYIIYIRMR